MQRSKRRLKFVPLFAGSALLVLMSGLPAQAADTPAAPATATAPATAPAAPAALPTPAASFPVVPPPAYPADYDVPGGHFYSETNGNAKPPTQGYSVTDEAGIPLWDEFQRWGGVSVLGYPISTRFQLGSFIVQAFQRGILQWRPDLGHSELLNVMDLLHDAGKDDVLQSLDQIPNQASNAAEAGKTPGEVIQARLKLLDFPNSGFRDTFNAAAHPLATFGLPTSVITDEGPSYTLRFQHAAMQLWKSDQAWAKANTVTLVNVGDLAKQNGLVPSTAAAPEPARMVLGEADHLPWSGWWWPSLTGSGPHLFDANGPLDKYDHYIQTLGQPDPLTQQWELAHFQFNDPKLDWAGKCNGWAVAALVEPEPTKPLTANGITFSVADQKGLLSDYHFADPAAWLVGGQDGGVKAADFHKRILDWIGTQRKGMVINAFNGSGQVASFAAYRFQAVYLPDPIDPNKTHVKMTLWAADYHVTPNFVGLTTWPDGGTKTYSYFIYGDRANPTAGDWEGDSVAGNYAHPENLWYPDLDPKARNLFGAFTSPSLDYGTILKILGR